MLGACSGESVLHEERSQLTAACSEGCDDPMPVAGQPATGGGAGVGTSSTAAAGKAKTNAERSACTAAKVGIVAPPCPDPDHCTGTSTITCTYAMMQCPVVGDFANDPRAWAKACKLSDEPAAWKATNCNVRNGPAGKPSFVLCTVDATATASTHCTPKSNSDCVAGEATDVATTGEPLLADDADAACTTHCDPTTDHKTASGAGSAINATKDGAKTAAWDNAKEDAKERAAMRLNIPPCRAPCKAFGAPLITFDLVVAGDCEWVVEWDDFSSQPDTNPADGIGDHWQGCCTKERNHNIHDVCTSTTTAHAKPWGAWCYANARANGKQLCVDENSICAAATDTAIGVSVGEP